MIVLLGLMIIGIGSIVASAVLFFRKRKWLGILVGGFGLFFFMAAAVIILALVQGVGPGVQDFVAHIAGDYSILRSSAHQIQIASNSRIDSTPIIPTKVIECDTDGRFVIAKRQGLKRRSPNNPDDTYEEPDPQVFDYWILDTRTPRVYGPLTFEQFTAKKKELALSPSLRLKDVYSFSP